MAIPNREDKSMYTSDEVDHIVARRVAAQQILELQNGHAELNRKLLELMNTIDTKLEKVYERVNGQPEQMNSCKTALKDEIKGDHPTYADMIELEKEIKKEVVAVDSEVKKFKHIVLGFSFAISIIIFMGNYIINETLYNLKNGISELKAEAKSESSKQYERHIEIERKLEAHSITDKKNASVK